MYVNIIAPKGIKKVRWYTDVEYKRMYPQKGIEENVSCMDFDARHAFGFGELGYITLYRGDEVRLQECVESHYESFRRNCTFGYYTPSYLRICDLPDGIDPVRLNWTEVMDHDTRMKSHEEVKKYVDSLLILDGDGTSQYQGNKDDWLEKDLVIKENKSRETQYGDKHTHLMSDAEGNLYVWETGAKNFESGTSVHLRMKVKEHKEIKGKKCTIVWYCKVI